MIVENTLKITKIIEKSGYLKGKIPKPIGKIAHKYSNRLTN